MAKLNYHILSATIVVISLTKVFALTDEDKAIVSAIMAPITADCSSEHGVSEGEIKSAKDSYNTDGLNSCFLGCVLKKTEFINSKGLLDVETGLNKAKGLLKNHDEFDKFEEIGKVCSKVNEESVGDGDSGCERAKLAFKCAIENKLEIFF
ncbi:unnamed protein product [Arctia plantaginis]|uniref:Uncharacterized protein n=1 Tax=Arctia plantaginis TaxID=874455 RepID=A0A8S1BB50_ARCPL|nr:unnamed protein product [Arctia plantaginis]